MSTNHYFGGKSADGHYHQIINLIPPHNTYIELFGGKLGIYRHKKPARRTFVIEKDDTLSDYYRSLGFIELYTDYEFNKYLNKPGKRKSFSYLGFHRLFRTALLPTRPLRLLHLRGPSISTPKH